MKLKKNNRINALWRNILVWVMIFIGLIYISSFVSAVGYNLTSKHGYVEQEFANRSYYWGGSGDGSYSVNNNWVAVYIGRLYDGNWETNDYPLSASVYAYFNVSYKIPVSVYPSEIIYWQVKDRNATRFITLNKTLLTPNYINVSVSAYQTTFPYFYNVTYYAKNVTNNWKSLYEDNLNSELYEEYMLWDIYVLYMLNESYNVIANSPSTQAFKINVTYAPQLYNTINAFLTYNNTNYTMEKRAYDTYDNSVQFSTSLSIPFYTNSLNQSFYFSISVDNGTGLEFYNSNTYNQTIQPVRINFCNSTYSIMLVNFTSADEEYRTPLTNTNFKIDLRLGENSLTNYIPFSNNITTNSLAVCLDVLPSSNLRMDYSIQYTNNNYSSEYVNVQNYTINSTNIYQNVTLYPLNYSNTQIFLIKVVDENYLPVTNSVIEIYRKYNELGYSLMVEAPITDSLGQAIAHLYKNDVLYTFVIKKNGRILATFSNVQPYCNILTQECILSLNIQGISANPENYLQYLNVNYLPTYDTNTHTYSVTYSTLDETEKTLSIYGWKLTNTQNISVCTNTITAQSGILTCVIPSEYQNSTILINAFVDNKLLFRDYIGSDYKKGDTLKNIRYILLAFLIPFFAMFSLSSGSLAIIFYIIGLIFGIGIFAIDTQSYIGAGSFLIWFIVAGIILIFKIMKGGIKNG